MPTAHGLSWAKNSSTRSRLSVLRSVTLPRRSTPCRSKICFAISIPILVTCIADPPVVRFRWSRYHRWLIMKPLNAGWVHLIILRVPRVESRSFSSIPERTYFAYVVSVGSHFLRLLTGRSPHLYIAGGVEPLRGSTCLLFSDGFQIFSLV